MPFYVESVSGKAVCPSKTSTWTLRARGLFIRVRQGVQPGGGLSSYRAAEIQSGGGVTC